MLYYSWEFQHKNVAISLPKARMFGNHSIFVPRLTDDDLGVYQCVIQNLDQSVTVSRIATVVLACKYSCFFPPGPMLGGGHIP